MSRIEEQIKQTKPFKDEFHKASVNLVFTGKWLINLHNEVFQEFGVSFQQYNVLRILKGCSPEPVTLKYVKVRLLDKMSDASRIIDVMCKKGVVKRSQSKSDRRKINIEITRSGSDILEAVESQQDRLYGFLSALNREEAEQLNKLLDKARG